MGVNLKSLTPRDPISVDDLKNKICVVDGYNILYQFLTTIRQADGTPLKDSSGRITSHLIGLFSRTTKLMQSGVKLAFVFDGVPPDLKHRELSRRKEAKLLAKEKYEQAKDEEDVESMKKYSMRTARLTKEMVEEAKLVLDYLGIPWVQAPSEGEAQMAYMVKQGDAWAGISQDYDSLLYGCPRLVQNLSIAGKRKLPGSPRYVNVVPEMITLKNVLTELELTLDQLTCLAMLVGMDYNPGGIHGLGPKKGLKLVKEHPDKEELFTTVEFDSKSEVPWKDIWDCVHTMPVEKEYDLKWGAVDGDKLHVYLVEEREFSAQRVESVLEALNATKAQRAQKSLGDF